MDPKWVETHGRKKYMREGELLGAVHREWDKGTTLYVASTKSGKRDFPSWSKAKRYVENAVSIQEKKNET